MLSNEEDKKNIIMPNITQDQTIRNRQDPRENCSNFMLILKELFLIVNICCKAFAIILIGLIFDRNNYHNLSREGFLEKFKALIKSLFYKNANSEPRVIGDIITWKEILKNQALNKLNQVK